MVGVRIEGGRRLRSTLRRAGDDLSDLKAAHRHAAEIVRPAAAYLAPARSGRLRADIRTGATARAGIIKAGRKPIPYAGAVHWGWPNRPNPAKDWRGGPIKANPFLSTAAQITENVWVPIYLRDVAVAIAKVKGK